MTDTTDTADTTIVDDNNARWHAEQQREAEEMQTRAIATARGAAHDDLAVVRERLALMDREVTRLGENDLYDFEFVESGQAATIYRDALTMVRIGLAAIEACIPRPER